MRHLNLCALTILLCCSFGAVTSQEYAWNKTDTKSAFLGIHSDQISKEKAKLLGYNNYYGSYVTKVLSNTAAEKCGLQPFDYIYGIDDYRTNGDQDLTDLIRKYHAGDKAKLQYYRKGKPMSTEITFGTRSETAREQVTSSAFLGVSPHEDENSDEAGVKVEVIQNTTAAGMGIQDGDVITSINGNKLIDWQDLTTAIANTKVGEKMTIEFEHGGKKQKAEKEIGAREKNDAEELVVLAPVAPKVKTNISRGFLGINSDMLSREKAAKLGFDNAYGSYVTRVIPNSSAEKGGIQPFDYIYGIDEYRTGEDQSLTSILGKYKPGDEVTIHYNRKGKMEHTKLVLGERVDDTIVRDQCDQPFFGISQSHQQDQEGMEVTIVDNSTAEAMGLKDGDIILAINEHPIIDWTDVTNSINNMKVGDPIKVKYKRKGEVMTGEKPIQSYCDTQKNGQWKWNGNDEPVAEDDDMGERISVDDVTVAVQDLNQEESNQIKQRLGLDLTTSNALSINDIQLHPNATMGMFRLEFTLPGTGDTNVRVFNGVGRLIYQYDLGNFSGPFSDEIDISQNGAGNYYLEVRQNDKKLTKKIILQSK